MRFAKSSVGQSCAAKCPRNNLQNFAQMTVMERRFHASVLAQFNSKLCLLPSQDLGGNRQLNQAFLILKLDMDLPVHVV